MKLLFTLRLVALTAFICLPLAGCNMFRGPDESGPKKFLIPWSENGSDYRLSVIEIKTLENMSRMEGKYAKVRYNQSSDKVAPEAQFVQRADGVYIPTDTTSLQMVAVYAHMEKLGELEDYLGLEGVLPRPRLVSVETKVVNNGKQEKDNAAFFGEMDVVAAMPISPGSLPIPLNGGILAHEHFHGIFYHMVLKHLLGNWRDSIVRHYSDNQKPMNGGSGSSVVDESTRDPKFFNRIVLTALNEGLADFWGWLYSKDPAFLEKSVKVAGLERRRVMKPVNPVPPRAFFKRRADVNAANFATGIAYELGSRFAGYLRAIAEAEGRAASAQALLMSLNNLREHWDSLESRNLVTPNVLARMVLYSDPKPSQARCCISKTFISNDYNDYDLVYRSCRDQGYTCDP